jgi:SpoVK/Ycf46/Vps4 family AAA+-type ATPase
LESVKDTLKELVMLPLQRPELFSKGHLMKVYCYAISFIFQSFIFTILAISVIYNK